MSSTRGDLSRKLNFVLVHFPEFSNLKRRSFNGGNETNGPRILSNARARPFIIRRSTHA